jgi:hypothetical protein
MSDYTWPAAWVPDRFELRIVPNTRVFVGPYTPTTQVIDLLGERWSFSMDLPPGVDTITGAAFEAFFDRLKGPANRIVLWNLRFPAPQGTVRQTDVQAVTVQNSSLATVTVQNSSLATVTVQSGQPQLSGYVLQGSNTAPVTGVPGKTYRAGDMIGLGVGQTVRTMVDMTLDANGQGTLEFQPRARSDIASFTSFITDKPTINFILKADGIPVVYRPGMFEGPSLEGIEAI